MTFHQAGHVVGLDRPGGQILEDAATVTRDGIAGFALGRDVGCDPQPARTERLPCVSGPRIRAQAPLVGAGGIGVADDRDVVEP